MTARAGRSRRRTDPPGSSSSGPRSTSWLCCFRNAGMTANPITGSVTTPPMTAPRPSVAPSRNLLRGKRSPGSGSGIAASPWSAGIAGASVAWPSLVAGAATAGAGRPRMTSRAQRNPQTTAIAAPIAAATQLTIRPTRRQTMPTAKPTGQRLGGGWCCSMSPRGSSTPTRLPSFFAGSIWPLDSIVAGLPRQRRNSWRNASAEAPRPYSSQRSSTRRRISSLISISSGHGRAPSAGPLWVASIPILPP